MTNIVTTPAGWVFNLTDMTFAESEQAPFAPLPGVSLATLVYQGASYFTSQAAARTVIDSFKRDWLIAARKVDPALKMSDVPKEAVPSPDSAEYRVRLEDARHKLFLRHVDGYVLNAREGASDPVEEEIDALARRWLAAFAAAQPKPWYTLPAKKKVAQDSDPYQDPKGRYATFGEALAAFVVSKADSKLFAMKDAQGKAWPCKVKAGVAISDLLRAEAERRVAERAEAKGGVSVAGEGDVEF